MKTTREEHLKWCKERAMEYVDKDDLSEAFASFSSDVQKHSETASIIETITVLGMPLLLMGALSTPDKMRAHILGYN